MRRHYGKADKCENKECLGKTKHFEWALIKGCKYEKNRNNFIKLCKLCHRKYDFTEEEMRQHAIKYFRPWWGKNGNFLIKRNTKLNKQKADEIRNLINEKGLSRKEVMKIYNVSHPTISDVMLNKVWI